MVAVRGVPVYDLSRKPGAATTTNVIATHASLRYIPDPLKTK
jgi:hypothetical protein